MHAGKYQTVFEEFLCGWPRTSMREKNSTAVFFKFLNFSDI